MILTWENEMHRVKLLLESLCKMKSNAELFKIKPVLSGGNNLI